jgi:hypothetical protein
MAYSQITDQVTGGVVSAATANQLQDNIEALKGGTGSVAPVNTISGLDSSVTSLQNNKLNISDIDDTPANDADTAVSSEWIYDNVFSQFRVKRLSTKSANYTITDTDGVYGIVLGNMNADITITLPTAGAANSYREIMFINTNSYASGGSSDNGRKLIIAPEGADEINGSNANIEIERINAGLVLKEYGSNWKIIKSFGDDVVGVKNLGTSQIEFVYSKYLTGNVDSDSSTTVAHGVGSGLTKIINIYADIFNDSISQRIANTVFREEVAAFEHSVIYDDTNVEFTGVGTNLQGNGYKIYIEYYI